MGLKSEMGTPALSIACQSVDTIHVPARLRVTNTKQRAFSCRTILATVFFVACLIATARPEVAAAQAADTRMAPGREQNGSRIERLATSRLIPHFSAPPRLGDEVVFEDRFAPAGSSIRTIQSESTLQTRAAEVAPPQLAAWLAALFAALPLVVSLMVSAVAALRTRSDSAMVVISVQPIRPKLDFEQECRQQLTSAVNLWRTAESSIFELDGRHPLRALLLKDLEQIGQRLSMRPALSAVHEGAVAVSLTPHYWRVLHRDISRAVRELSRICSVANAANVSIGGQNSAPRVPKDLREAYFVLGVNPDVSEDTLKRLVRALRQCWHPDVAQNDEDRSYREARIRQINVANDLIMKRESQVTT